MKYGSEAHRAWVRKRAEALDAHYMVDYEYAELKTIVVCLGYMHNDEIPMAEYWRTSDDPTRSKDKFSFVCIRRLGVDPTDDAEAWWDAMKAGMGSVDLSRFVVG
jgi:hypothetical protein